MKVWLHNSEPAPVRRNDVVIITGDGRTLEDDFIRATLLIDADFDIFSLARSYQCHGEKIDHWGDVDGEASIWWAKNGSFLWVRQPQRHTLGAIDGFDFDWDSDQPRFDERPDKWWGSTALFATLVSISLGYERILLAGCPLDVSGHWYALPHENGPNWDVEDYNAWQEFATQIEAEKVRSMSGFTLDLLGAPDRQWLMKSP